MAPGAASQPAAAMQTSLTAMSTFSPSASPAAGAQRHPSATFAPMAVQNGSAQTFANDDVFGASTYTASPTDTTGFGVLRPAETTQLQDRRVRDPVPSKLKGRADAKKGNFAVMHMDVSTSEFKERHKAAKRTSESTELAAKRAARNGSVAGGKRRSSTMPSDQEAILVSPTATKEDQARLLTLLRSLNPVLVVDQICKALAYFGGIPGAPPPSDAKFPASARGNGSGAVFVGWMAEIFPKVEHGGVGLAPGPMQGAIPITDPIPAALPEVKTQLHTDAPAPAPAPTAVPVPPVPTQAPVEAAPPVSLPSANPTGEKRRRGRPKGSKATKARKDKGIKKGPLKARQAALAASQDSGLGAGATADDSWVDVDSTVLGGGVDTQTSLGQPSSAIGLNQPQTGILQAAPAPPVTPVAPAAAPRPTEADTGSASGRRKGRPKGTKNKPKDVTSATSTAASASSVVPATVTPIPPPVIPQAASSAPAAKKPARPRKPAAKKQAADTQQAFQDGYHSGSNVLTAAAPRGSLPSASQLDGSEFAASALQHAYASVPQSTSQITSFTPANAPAVDAVANPSAPAAAQPETTGTKRKRKPPKKAEKAQAAAEQANTQTPAQPPLALPNGNENLLQAVNQTVQPIDTTTSNIPPPKRQKKEKGPPKPRGKKKPPTSQADDAGGPFVAAPVPQIDTEPVVMSEYSPAAAHEDLSSEAFASLSSSFGRPAVTMASSQPSQSSSTLQATGQQRPQAYFRPPQRSPNMLAAQMQQVNDAGQNPASLQQKQQRQLSAQMVSPTPSQLSIPATTASVGSATSHTSQQQQRNSQQFFSQGRPADMSQYTAHHHHQQSPQLSAQYTAAAATPIQQQHQQKQQQQAFSAAVQFQQQQQQQQFPSHMQQPTSQMQYSQQRQHQMATSSNSPSLLPQQTATSAAAATATATSAHHHHGSPHFTAASTAQQRSLGGAGMSFGTGTSTGTGGGPSSRRSMSSAAASSPALNPAAAHSPAASFSHRARQAGQYQSGGGGGFESAAPSLFDGMGGGLDAAGAAGGGGAGFVPRTTAGGFSGTSAAEVGGGGGGAGHQYQHHRQQQQQQGGGGGGGQQQQQGQGLSAFDRFYQVR